MLAFKMTSFKTKKKFIFTLIAFITTPTIFYFFFFLTNPNKNTQHENNQINSKTENSFKIRIRRAATSSESSLSNSHTTVPTPPSSSFSAKPSIPLRIAPKQVENKTKTSPGTKPEGDLNGNSIDPMSTFPLSTLWKNRVPQCAHRNVRKHILHLIYHYLISYLNKKS